MTRPIHARIEALALAFPPNIRTNDDIRREHPDRVARAAEGALARVFPELSSDDLAATQWAAAMQPHARDPFLGTVERRILAPGQTAVDLEAEAVHKALDAAGIGLDAVDLILVNSMFPDHAEEGDSGWLCRALGYRGAAWNINAMCGGGIVGLQLAQALIEQGMYRRVLLVVCCTYSRCFDPGSAASFVVGDGAAACLVGADERIRSLNGWGIVNGSEACGVARNSLTVDGSGTAVLRTTLGRQLGRLMPHLVANYLTRTANAALNQAQWTADELDGVLIFGTTRWYSAFGRSVLGVSDVSSICVYPLYGVMSPVVILANLYHAADAELFVPGDRVLLFSHGFVGASGALALQWQPFALGAPPALGDARPTIRRRGAAAA